MTVRRRLTRQESKELTQMRLIEAAERLFIRKGFDDVSVDEISEVAGYSRGAFYSNFKDKEQIFLAVVDRRRPQLFGALEGIFHQTSEPAERIAAVREWFSNLWRLKGFVALQMEFSPRAIKDRGVRDRLAEFWRNELENATASVVRYFGDAAILPAGRPEVLALALLAVARGLASLATATEPEREQMYTEAATLVFDRVTAPGSLD